MVFCYTFTQYNKHFIYETSQLTLDATHSLNFFTIILMWVNVYFHKNITLILALELLLQSFLFHVKHCQELNFSSTDMIYEKNK